MSTAETKQLQQSDWFKAIKEDIDKRMYYLVADKQSNSFRSVNNEQNLEADYSASAFKLEPMLSSDKKPKADKWELNISVNGLSADGLSMNASANQVTNIASNGNDVEYNFSNRYAIQYHNDKKGVRQNFIVKEKPSSNTREVIVSMKAEGDWVVNKVHDKELHFAKKNSKGTLDSKIVYNDLKAWDATGKQLSSRMETKDDNNFEIITNVENAVYPVTIDPLSSSPSSTLNGSSATDVFGTSMASAGDVNGDGYSDVIVGAPGVSGYAGAAYIFLGSASGLSSSPAATLSGINALDSFGVSVATAGDINGDGYADIIVGAPGVSSNAGAAYIFLGSNSGIATASASAATAVLTTGSATANQYFGTSVASAGDVNGDSFSDIIVGAYGVTTNQGAAYVYSGSSTGIATGASPSATINGGSTLGVGDRLGFSVATAGDINSDGYSDIIIGAPFKSLGTGAAYIYQGSPSGIGATASATLTGAALSGLGTSVASAGDVNGDGYSDVIIGAPGVSSFQGAAYIFLGTNSGIANANASSAATTFSGTASNQYFGASVASAGDMNGDNYSDVIIGAFGTSGNAGAAYIYEGTSSGISNSATPALTLNGANPGDSYGFSVASAGDVNGDGISDVLVGAPNSSTATGIVYVYNGNTDVSISTANVSIVGSNAGDRYGLSVSSAGDVNGDGYNDVVVGAIGVNGITGAAYVYYGSSTGLSVGSPTIITIPFTGNSENFGWSVTASDINGDGYDDIIVGAQAQNTSSGVVYIYLGSVSGINTSPSSTLNGLNSFDTFGYSVASAGDVNGDGYGDIVVGAPGVSLTGTNEGAAYIYLGSASGIATNAPADTLYGPNAFGGFGVSVSTAGDVNGDGYSDIIVGTSGGGGDAAYVFFGSKTGIANKQAPDVSLAGDFGNGTSGDFGISVSTAGDVNGDGYSDVIVGAPSGGGNGTGGGAAGIFLGGASGLSTTASVVLSGLVAGDQFGASVATAGDVNGDGYSDVIVRSTLGTNSFPSQTGAVYLFLGSPTGTNSTLAASFLDANSGASYASTEVPRRAIGGAGDVNGDGYSDFMIGVYEDPTLGTKTGKMYMYYGNNAVGRNASNVLKLYETDLTNPIAADNLSQSNFGLGLFAQSPFGSVKGKLVWETETNGVPFHGNPITNSVVLTGKQSSYTLIPVGGTEFKNLIAKVTGKATKVRVRLQYAATSVTFGQVYSPWIYSQVYLLGGNLGVLPLDLLSFTATTSGSDILLKWKSANEVDLSNYVVEHSVDGVKFDSLGSVTAKGTIGTSSYDFTHVHPSVGIHYYRLREVNKDGNKTYSLVVSAKISGNIEFNIYPNPASDHIVVTHTGITSSSVRIMNAAGAVMGQYKLNLNSDKTTILLNGFAKGNYFVEIINSGFAPKQITVQ
ncbi:MAG TPA: FG-GAP-like repeat-containing protein [Puia sp.]|nr:FG-GAP-like repeat-containing protein [Puia sp.]